MNTLPYIISGGALTVFVHGVPHSLDDSHPNFGKVYDMLGTDDCDETELIKLVSQREALKVIVETYGDVSVGLDSILYRDRVVNSYLTKSMLAIMGMGKDIGPWARFMDKLYLNPSKTAVDELFLWLEKANMPITTEGNFLAYKKVKDDYTSFHLNADGSSVDNRVGASPSMPRYEVDDNRDSLCSTGLHFCSWHYLPKYKGGRGKVIIVEVNPADVVAITADFQNSKGRAWTYRVVGEIDQVHTEFAFAGVPLTD
ncbi:MAG: hypothetical protein EOQ39_18515 [Mesorhizobium sp.]|uniref:hypothetical protein n=1 Tax=Mesorhizobium sp. TaxID=1871066 RepID=UPI000FE85EEB|nr:hypothetical protein [Mesorhizobium sp.]RWB08833.1 MAG: hypothetical protein EOQ37_04830 [Mesorhizobium sp.]RWB13517.1 MAG: hypothetical protein EOQ39_18515 [Mesorhizobium sp.]